MRPAQREEAWRNKISAREGQIKKYLIKVPRDSMVFTNAASQKSIFDTLPVSWRIFTSLNFKQKKRLVAVQLVF